MASLQAEAGALVNKYFHDRKEEMEEMHDAFGVRPPEPKASKPKLQSWDKSRYETLPLFIRYAT